jgi:hypothetical protein
MVDAPLTDDMIESGAELVRRLDAGGMQPDAAFWQYFPELQEWKLVIVEVKLGHVGPREIYSQIQHLMAQADVELSGLSLDSVTLAKPDSLVVSLLRHAIRTGEGISRVRFTNNVINGTLVEDAYIYRLT